MVAPTVTWTPTAATMDDAFVLMQHIASYESSGQDTLFDAWATWAAASGTTDDKAAATKYSGYAYTTWWSLAGFPSLAAEATLATAFPSAPTVGWYMCGNGMCMRDTEYGLGGTCMFFWADECDTVPNVSADPAVVYPPPATNAALHHFILTDAQFNTYLDDVVLTTDGLEYYKGLEAAVTATTITEATGSEYFDYPGCEDTSTASDMTSFKCFKYQRALEQEEDGYPRFNAPQAFTFYEITGFINVDYTYMDAIRFLKQVYIWDGASSLTAMAATLAATSLLAF